MKVARTRNAFGNFHSEVSRAFCVSLEWSGGGFRVKIKHSIHRSSETLSEAAAEFDGFDAADRRVIIISGHHSTLLLKMKMYNVGEVAYAAIPP